MKTYYAVHEDKTHVKVKSLTDFYTQFREKSEWGFVQADSKGWIPHVGDVCPLPDDVMCDAVMEAGSVIEGMYSYKFNWRSVVKYRPILKAFEKWDENHITRPPEKVQEPDPAANLTANTVDLLGTLIRAHKAAQTIPDLEAELREVLAGMGYDLVARSPFVEPAPAVETAQDAVIAGALFDFLGFLTTRDKPTSFGAICNASPAVELLQEWADKRGLDLKGADVTDWHSRPAKGEK